MTDSGIVFTPPLPVGAALRRVYRVNSSSMTEVLLDGTYGETLPLPVVNGEKKARCTGSPALLRRLRNAERALRRARTVERRAVARVHAAMAALDKANGRRDGDPVTGTWSYKVTFVEKPA